jgi:antitoxin component YwqK of YwqJK toxin-antitoxin module
MGRTLVLVMLGVWLAGVGAGQSEPAVPAAADTPEVYWYEDYYDNGNLWRRYSFYYSAANPWLRVYHGPYYQFMYWHSGVVGYEAHYQHGVVHGQVRDYLPCGKTRWEATFRNGKRQGTTRQTTYFDQEGCGAIRHLYTENYVDDVRDGETVETYFYENGNVASRKTVPYRNGVREGRYEEVYYHPDGSIAARSRVNYVDDFMIDGDHESTYTYPGGPQQPSNLPITQRWTTLYGLTHGRHWSLNPATAGGKTSVTIDYRFGLKEGDEIHEWVAFGPNTSGASPGYRFQSNKGGLAHGPSYGDYMSSDFSRQRMYTTAFAYGKAHGTRTSWYTNTQGLVGMLESTGRVSNGKMCGQWTTSRPRWNFQTQRYEVEYETVNYGPCEPLEIPGGLAPSAIVGTILDRQLGVPLANVAVSVPGASATTDALGRFEVQAPAGASVTQVSMQRPGTVARTIPVAIKPGAPTNLGALSMVRIKPKPLLVDVAHNYPERAIFLAGVEVPPEVYKATVDWNNVDARVGQVVFRVRGQERSITPSTQEPTLAEATYALHTAPFVPSLEPLANRVTVRALLDGVASDPVHVDLMVIPVPAWITAFGNFGVAAHDASYGLLSYKLKAEYPSQPIAIQISPQSLGPTLWQAWSLMPMIGGRNFGIPPTKAELELEVKSDGTGSVALAGVTGFEAAGKKIEGKLGGAGNMAYVPGKGLTWQGATMILGVKGTIEEKAGIVTVIPALSGATSMPYIGGLISRFNNLAQVEGRVYAESNNSLEIVSKTNELGFHSASGNIKVGLNLGLAAPVHEKLKATLLGGGETVLYWEVPANPDYLKDAESKLYANLVFNIWSFEKTFAGEFGFRLSDPGKAMFGAFDAAEAMAPMQPLVFVVPDAEKYHLIATSSVMPSPAKTAAGAPVRTTVVTNTFRHPAPALLGGNPEMLALVTFKPALPSLQATEVQVLNFADANPSATAVALTNDTRGDFAPTLARDAAGRVVVVWERVRDEALASEEIEDMAARMEIAFAWRDAATGAWSAPTFLTSNAHLDYAPRLLTAPDGSLALTWLSQASSQLLASTTHPVRLHLASWDSSTQTFTPAATTLEFTNLVSHASAWDGAEASVIAILDEDGDPLTSDDTRVARYRHDGAWSAAELLTSGAGANELPWAGQSSAGGDVLWVREGELVHARNGGAATAAGPRAGIAQPGTVAAAVRDDGALAIVWQEPTPGGVGLAASVRDPLAGAWSEAITLDAGPRVGDIPQIAFTAQGHLALVFPVHDVAGETFEVLATDLVRVEQSLARDLAFDAASLRFEPEQPAPGETVTVHVDVVNHGELAVVDPVVASRIGTPNAAGAETGRVTISGVLPGRDRVATSFAVTVPASPADPHYLHLVLDPDNALAERDETNNAAMRSLLLPDLEIVGTRSEALPLSETIRVWIELRNNGVVDVAMADLLVLIEGVDSGRLRSPLPAGASRTVHLDLARADLRDTIKRIEFVLDPDKAIDESTRANNRLEIALSHWDLGEAFEGEVAVVADPPEGGTISGAGRFPAWSTKRLVATPNAGFRFGGWNDGLPDEARDVVVTHNGVTTWTASFTRQRGTLVVQASPPEGGTVAGGGTFDLRSDQVLTATPGTGWRLASWGNDAGLRDGNRQTERTVRVLAEEETYIAHFEPAGTLRVTIQPAEARAAGAAWRRTTSVRWSDSDAVETDAAVGDASIEFRVIPGWMTPPRRAVTVTAGEATTVEATYTPVLASDGSVWILH